MKELTIHNDGAIFKITVNPANDEEALNLPESLAGLPEASSNVGYGW